MYILNVIIDKWQLSLIAIHSQSILDNWDQLVNNLSLIFVRLLDIILTDWSLQDQQYLWRMEQCLHEACWSCPSHCMESHWQSAKRLSALFHHRRGDTPSKTQKTAHSHPAGETSQTVLRQEPRYLMKIIFDVFYKYTCKKYLFLYFCSYEGIMSWGVIVNGDYVCLPAYWR